MKFAVPGVRKNTAGNFEKRAQLVTVFHGVGRGGEIKFLQYPEMMWDYRYELVDTGWFESKNLESYAMAMISDRSGYACDWYHSLGSYYAVENGLFRNKDKVKVADFLFPNLHSQ